MLHQLAGLPWRWRPADECLGEAVNEISPPARHVCSVRADDDYCSAPPGNACELAQVWNRILVILDHSHIEDQIGATIGKTDRISVTDPKFELRIELAAFNDHLRRNINANVTGPLSVKERAIVARPTPDIDC